MEKQIRLTLMASVGLLVLILSSSQLPTLVETGLRATVILVTTSHIVCSWWAAYFNHRFRADGSGRFVLGWTSLVPFALIFMTFYWLLSTQGANGLSIVKFIAFTGPLLVFHVNRQDRGFLALIKLRGANPDFKWQRTFLLPLLFGVDLLLVLGLAWDTSSHSPVLFLLPLVGLGACAWAMRRSAHSGSPARDYLSLLLLDQILKVTAILGRLDFFIIVLLRKGRHEWLYSSLVGEFFHARKSVEQIQGVPGAERAVVGSRVVFWTLTAVCTLVLSTLFASSSLIMSPSFTTWLYSSLSVDSTQALVLNSASIALFATALLHHYLLDSVVWKLSDGDYGHYLRTTLMPRDQRVF